MARCEVHAENSVSTTLKVFLIVASATGLGISRFECNTRLACSITPFAVASTFRGRRMRFMSSLRLNSATSVTFDPVFI